MKIRYVVFASAVAGVALGVGITWADFGRTPPFDRAAQLLAEGQGVPKLVVDNESHDFGAIDRFASVQHKFRITNVGNGTLTLKAGRTTCTACTIAELSKPEVPPGETAEVIVDYSPRTASPEFQQLAFVITNDPDKPRIELKITGRIRTKFRTLPDKIVFSDASVSAPSTAEVKIISFVSDKLEVMGHTFADNDVKDFLEAEFEPMGPEELHKIDPLAKSGCRVLVTLKPGLPLGPFRQTIFVAFDTGQEGRADFELPVEGAVVSDLSIVGPGWNGSRGVLTLGAVDSERGTKRKLSVLVRGKSRHDVEIEPLKLDPPWLKVEVGEPQQLTESVVRIPLEVEIPPGSPSAAYRGANAEAADHAQIILGVKNHPDAKEIRMLLTFVTGKKNE